ncbi:MAG: DUF4157 domain-containing protein, partial [Bacteroidota bacterium]|nr:DUF4157 domain-containing protein [Bacteroidota bacterium]
MSAATTTSGKSKTAGKVSPSRSTPHVTPASQHANGTVMTKPNASANLVKSGTPSAKPNIQPKLTVGKPNDSFEQQADAMAQKVVSMSPAEIQQQNSSKKSPARQINPSAEKASRTPLQKKDQPGAFMLRASAEKEKVSKKEDEKIKKKADPEVAGEKLQKAPEKKVQKSVEAVQAKEEEKLQKKEPELKKKADEKLQKKTEPEKIQKAPEPKIAPKEIVQAKPVVVQAKPVVVQAKPVLLKEDEKLQKKTEEKLQKKAEPEKIHKAPEPKVAPKENIQAKPVTIQTKPVQLKEEEKLRKMEGELKKKTEQKLQKAADEKIHKAPEPKIAPKEIVQAKPAVVQTKPVQLKEEEKIQKANEEKVMKAEQEKKEFTGAGGKVQKAGEEKVMKAEQEKKEFTGAGGKVQKAGEEKVMKSGEGENELTPEFEARLQGTLSSGTPMGRTLRAYMESRFGADFSAVRFHMDTVAIQMCNEIGARAFAYQNHVYFNRGQYQPDTDSGRFLFAHELTDVIQQGYATQKGAEGKAPVRPAAKAEEKVQKSKQNISSTSPRIQRLGWDTVNNAVRRVVPIWTLLTVIMGYNPILGENVPRGPIQWFQGMLDLIPVIGPSIFDKLQSSGMLARAEAWFNTAMSGLPSMGEIRATWDRCWSEMGILEGIDGNIAIFRRHFGPVFTRIGTFVNRVLAKVVEILRETLLRPLNNVVKDIPGWELITTLIGSNPLTGENKPRTAMNVLRGVVAFIPGGQEKLDQLVQSQALERAYQWFVTETTARNLTWPRIQATFTQAWDSLSANDILHPIDTFNRLRGIVSPLLIDLGGFALAALEKLLEFIFEAVMGAGGAAVLAVLKKARSTFLTIIRDPVRFLGNLMRAVGQGIRQFGTNILTHLRDGVIAWLTGPIAASGIQMPERWDLKGFIWFGLQILGLTWDKVKTRMVRILGAPVVQAMETGVEIVMEIREKGVVQALKDRVSEFFGGLKDLLLNKIKSFIIEKIVTAGIQQLVALLSPVGAVIDAILKTYNTVMFFIDNIRRIVEFVNSVLDSVAAIAEGNLGQAAGFIERTMARTIPILLDFLARFLGLGNVAAKVKTAIESVQNWVGEKLDAVINWIKTQALRLMQAGRNAVSSLVNWLGLRKSFQTRDGQNHSIFVEDVQGRPTLMIASQKQPFAQYLSTLTVPATDVAKTQAKQNATTSQGTITTELTNLKAMETSFGNSPTSTQRGQLNQKQVTIRTQYDILSESVKILGIGNSREETVLTDIQPAGGSKLLRIAARPLSALRGNTTGNANAQSGGVIPGWPVLDGINTTRNNDRTIYNDWVRMHLIHSSLHGPAQAFNLVAAPRAFNTLIYNSIESPAVRAVLEPGTILHYSVSITYGNASPVQDFPTRIEYTWGKLKRKDDGSFENDGSNIASAFGQNITPPQVTPGSGPPTYVLKNMGRPS